MALPLSSLRLVSFSDQEQALCAPHACMCTRIALLRTSLLIVPHRTAPPRIRRRSSFSRRWRPPPPPASWIWRWWWKSAATATRPCSTPPTPPATAHSSTPPRVGGFGGEGGGEGPAGWLARVGRGGVRVPVDVKDDRCGVGGSGDQRPSYAHAPSRPNVNPLERAPSQAPSFQSEHAHPCSQIPRGFAAASWPAHESRATVVLPPCHPVRRRGAAGGRRLCCLPLPGRPGAGAGQLPAPAGHAAQQVGAPGGGWWGRGSWGWGRVVGQGSGRDSVEACSARWQGRREATAPSLTRCCRCVRARIPACLPACRWVPLPSPASAAAPPQPPPLPPPRRPQERAGAAGL
jgi:hypothetical protein